LPDYCGGMKPEEATQHIFVQLGWTEVAFAVLLVAALQFLVGLWIKARLEASVKHEYDRRLKNYESQLRIRDQAARVAELFALAFSPETTPTRFNQLAWELSLWLPAPLVCDLSRCLVGDKSAKTPKEILIEVRKILLESPDDPLRPENLVHREDPYSRAELTEASVRNRELRDLSR
jgi:hypothetical protein